MKALNPVHTYYESLAAGYDTNRFGNSYGEFVHAQELVFINNLLGINTKNKVLNLGCGTGRFMEFATDGLDFSGNMLEVAKQKFPDKRFYHGDARATNFDEKSFDAVICLHVLMHQDKASSAEILRECLRLLKPEGLLILDFPSARRRKLLGHEPHGWHGGNAYSLAEFQKLVSGQFKLEATSGILFFPIHRISKPVRKLIFPLDKALCRSPFLEFSSYLMLALRRC